MLANRRLYAPIRVSAIAGFLLVLPFAILEYVFNMLNNARAFNPSNLAGLAVLFGIMWLLPTVFFAILIPMVRNIRAGNTITTQPLVLLLRVGLLVLIAWGWAALVSDQLPCFLGVPNCD